MKFPIWFFVSLLVASAVVAIAKPQNASQGLSPTEKWVVGQVKAGQEADLNNQFPTENDRKLSAHFLEDLLTGTLPGVKPPRIGVRITGAIIDEPIDLENAQIPCDIWLDSCQFSGRATFVGARFAGTVSFDDSAFKAYADFKDIKVGGYALFDGAVFEGPADFSGADIAGNLEADETHFQNKEQSADFERMKVGSNMFFENAVFEGPVDCHLAKIVGEFNASGAQFKNTEQSADFKGMRVGSGVVFRNTVFEGSVSFVGADIARNFEADGAAFQNKDSGVDFNSMKVGHAAFFKNAVFEGRVDFGSADIASNFEADGAAFRNKDSEANFSSMHVRGNAFFKNAVFEGPVDFGSVDIANNFQAQGARFHNKDSEANFSSMHVRGNAFFSNAVFEGWVNFNYANFAWLSLSSVSRPKLASQFQMQGMSYNYVRAAPGNEGHEPESHKALLDLADQSAYTADVYTNLEQFFLRQGYREAADRAFIAGKRRERSQYFQEHSWLRWSGSWLLDKLVGYGRRPWQAGVPCLFFVALGCFLFSPEKMESQAQGDTRRIYNRFWYSLGLFLPVVDLQSDRVWKPKQEHTFLRTYMRVQILLGWILIPIVLAALTGLIK